jgi:hypothetical protein
LQPGFLLYDVQRVSPHSRPDIYPSFAAKDARSTSGQVIMKQSAGGMVYCDDGQKSEAGEPV